MDKKNLVPDMIEDRPATEIKNPLSHLLKIKLVISTCRESRKIKNIAINHVGTDSQVPKSMSSNYFSRLELHCTDFSSEI